MQRLRQRSSQISPSAKRWLHIPPHTHAKHTHAKHRERSTLSSAPVVCQRRRQGLEVQRSHFLAAPGRWLRRGCGGIGGSASRWERAVPWVSMYYIYMSDTLLYTWVILILYTCTCANCLAVRRCVTSFEWPHGLPERTAGFLGPKTPNHRIFFEWRRMLLIFGTRVHMA